MKHDKPTNIYGYDPIFWKSRKRAAWTSGAALALAALGFFGVDLWPGALKTAFFIVGVIAASGLWLFLSQMWDSRRFHPWVAERFYRPHE